MEGTRLIDGEIVVDGVPFESSEEARDMGFYPDEDKIRIKNDQTVVVLDLYEQMRYRGWI